MYSLPFHTQLLVLQVVALQQCLAISKQCVKYVIATVLFLFLTRLCVAWVEQAKCTHGNGKISHLHPIFKLLGKGLGGGYAPLAAVLMSAKVVNAFAAGSGAFNNGYTYQSHALGCRAAFEILKVMKEDGLIEQCYQRGLFLKKMLD